MIIALAIEFGCCGSSAASCVTSCWENVLTCAGLCGHLRGDLEVVLPFPLVQVGEALLTLVCRGLDLALPLFLSFGI